MNLKKHYPSLYLLAITLSFFIASTAQGKQNNSNSSSPDPSAPNPNSDPFPNEKNNAPAGDLKTKVSQPEQTLTPGPQMTLGQVLKAADERNVTVRAAKMEIEKASAKLSQAWALVLPGVDGKLEYTRMDHEDAADFGGATIVLNPQNTLKGTLGVGISLINFQSWQQIKMAKKGVSIATLSIENARQQLLLGVAQAYLMALQAKELIGLREEQRKTAQHHLEIATAKFEAGAGLKIDVIRAKTDLQKNEQEILTAKLFFDNARDAIALLIDSDKLPMPVSSPDLKKPELSNKELIANAQKNRADLKVKTSMIELYQKQLDASWMQFLPKLDLGWQFQYHFTELAAMGSTDRSRWALALTLTVPIYNHFRYGDLDEKRATIRQAIFEQEDQEKNIALEVRKAKRDYMTAISSVTIAESQAALAKEGLALVEISYKAGTGSSLEMTDAMEQVSAANINVINKNLEAQIALLKLLYAVGQNMAELN